MPKQIPKQTIKIMPPKPNMEEQTIENCEIAKAKAISALHNTDKDILEMLSTIDEHDRKTYALLLSIANDKELNLDDYIKDENGDNVYSGNFLKDYVYHDLKLANSVPAKKGGIRSEQTVQVAKSPDYQEQNDGIFQKIRNKFH